MKAPLVPAAMVQLCCLDERANKGILRYGLIPNARPQNGRQSMQFQMLFERWERVRENEGNVTASNRSKL